MTLGMVIIHFHVYYDQLCVHKLHVYSVQVKHFYITIIDEGTKSVCKQMVKMSQGTKKCRGVSWFPELTDKM